MKNKTVHRINFYEPDLKSIRCLAYDCSISRLAVSRSDASIEIWDVMKNPYLEKVIPSILNTSVETLTWCNGRLFSAGLFGYIYEYDLSTLMLKYQLLVTSGCPVWCMAVNHQKTTLAIGNKDGQIVLHDFSLDGLDFQKKLDKQEGSILCLAWHKDGQTIVTGSEGTIGVWNVETGHVTHRIILGRVTKNTPTIVWCISILSDMTIVSGDSCGKTSFWDGKTGTQISNLAVHEGDVLTTCISEDENVVYTCGVDPVIQMFMKSQYNGSWWKSIRRTVHTHDVRALQLVDNFLVSGGDDCNLVFTKYPPKTTIKYFPFCQMSYASIAPLASCILLRYPSYLEMWRIGSSSSGNSSKKLLQVKAKSSEVITCSSVSADGKWLTYSSQFQMRLFSIFMEDNSSSAPSISKVVLPKEIPSTASILLFTPEPVKLIIYSKGNIYILKCDKNVPKLVGTIEENLDAGYQTHLMELSSNGLYLACGSYNGNVVIYSLETLKVLYKLPHYRYQPTVMKFDPSSENLLVAYSDRKIIEYSLTYQAYSNWSKKQMLINLQHASIHPITSIICDADKVYFQDENCIYVCNKENQSCQEKKKLKVSEDSSVNLGGENFTSITKYEHISSIHDFLNDLVVVEISSRHTEKALPAPIWKKRYGT